MTTQKDIRRDREVGKCSVCGRWFSAHTRAQFAACLSQATTVKDHDDSHTHRDHKGNPYQVHSHPHAHDEPEHIEGHDTLVHGHSLDIPRVQVYDGGVLTNECSINEFINANADDNPDWPAQTRERLERLMIDEAVQLGGGAGVDIVVKRVV